MKKVLFLYNPISGEGHIKSQLDKIIMAYQKEGYLVILYRITREKGLSKLSQAIAAVCPDYLLVAGGDGTLNRLVNYLKYHNVTIPLAILPTGTANDFAHMIGMPNNVMDACRAILRGEVRHLDMGRVNDRYFINVLSSGLFTEVSQKTPTALKNTFGKVAYYFSSLGELPSFHKMNIRVTAEGHEGYAGSCLLMLVFNGRTAGNFQLATRSDSEDGLLDVLIFKGENIVNNIHTGFKVLMRRDLATSHDIVYFQTRSLRIENDHKTTDIDGERGPEFPLEIECLPGALPIVFPASGLVRPESSGEESN